MKGFDASFPPRMDSPPGVRQMEGLPLVAMALLGYGATAAFSIWLSRQPGSVASLWYANAWGVFLLLSSTRAQWPQVLAWCALANVLANMALGDDVLRALLFVPPNVVEMALAGLLLERLKAPEDCINNPQRLVPALLCGAVLPTLLSAALGAAQWSLLEDRSFLRTYLAWVQGGLIGAVSLLPMSLLVVARGWRALGAALKRLDVLALLLLVAAAALLAPVALPFPYVYISVLLALVAVVGRFAAAALSVLLCSLIVGSLIAHGVFRALPTVSPWEELLFYLPLILTLIPPVLLASALEQAEISTLAASQAHYRSIYERTPAMMYSVDDQGLMVSVSVLWLSRMGFEQSEVLGKPVTRFLTPQSRRHLEQSIRPRMRRDGFSTDEHIDMVTKNGDIVNMLVSAIAESGPDNPVFRTLVVMEDITEKKRIAKELADQHELLNLTLQSIGDGVLTTDDQGKVTSLNPVAERLLACSSDQARGQPFEAVVRLVDTQGHNPAAMMAARCLASRDTLRPEGVITLQAPGGDHALQMSMAPILANGEQVRGLIMVFQDATLRHAMEQEIRALNVDLEKRIALRTSELQAAMSEMESFAYTISHDFRAPLRLVAAYAEMLKSSPESTSEVMRLKMLGRIHEGATRLGQLIDSLLAFAHFSSQPLQRAPVDMNALLDDVIGQFNLDPQRVDVVCGPLPEGQGNDVLLGRVWRNLIDNALKFSGRQSHPRVEIGFDDKESAYFVRDNGVGFDMRYADKLFRMFTRLHHVSEYAGQGAGLAIARRIIERHGGQIWADSSPGQGTTVHFTLGARSEIAAGEDA